MPRYCVTVKLKDGTLVKLQFPAPPSPEQLERAKIETQEFVDALDVENAAAELEDL